jgi:hypothetical protein
MGVGRISRSLTTTGWFSQKGRRLSFRPFLNASVMYKWLNASSNLATRAFLPYQLLALTVHAFDIDNFTAEGAEHLLDHWIFFRGLAQALFLELLLASFGLFL